MGLNELKNVIDNFMTFSEILQAFKLCLLKNLSSYINHNLPFLPLGITSYRFWEHLPSLGERENKAERLVG